MQANCHLQKERLYRRPDQDFHQNVCLNAPLFLILEIKWKVEGPKELLVHINMILPNFGFCLIFWMNGAR